MRRVRAASFLLSIVLLAALLGRSGAVHAQEPQGVTPSEVHTLNACPPDAIFGCLLTGNGPYGWRVQNSSTSSNAYAIWGRLMPSSPGANSAAVRGEARGTTSAGYGVMGTHAGNGTGVYGYSLGAGYGFRGYSANGTGVYASTNGTGIQRGMYGEHTATTGTGAGVEGRTNSISAGYGVRGHGPIGVQGNSTNANGAGVRGDGTNGGVVGVGGVYGVYGESSAGTGVWGKSTTQYGVYGTSTDSYGVRGFSVNDYGVYGESSSFIGVYGYSSNGFGVRGESNSSYAGYFSGPVYVVGTLFKLGGSFRIDHPLDPENQYLSHSFVESPDMMNVYNGNITTDANGDATVELPAYFESLNRDFRYQLTVIGQFAQAIVATKVQNNQFTIKTDKPHVEVSWQVTGIRQDAWANENRIVVEEPKPEDERGTYLYPEGFGQPENRGVDYEERQLPQQLAEPAAPTRDVHQAPEALPVP